MAIYLDYNATTPVALQVNQTICETLANNWGNPSSSYQLGKEAQDIIKMSREQVAIMINCRSDEIIFTSGGTESNNIVIHTAIEQYLSKFNSTINTTSDVDSKPHIIITNIEHDSVQLPLVANIAKGKIDITLVPVSTITGAVEVDDIINAIRPNTCLISVMLANNETGVIQPLKSLSLAIKSYMSKNKQSILLHTDAAQALGKILVDVEDLGVDYLTIVGHKFYGPRIGALYFKKGKLVLPMFYGGGQERKYRPGTENTCMIAGLGKAAELVYLNLDYYEEKMKKTRDHLENQLREVFGNKVIFNIKSSIERLPNTSSVAFDYDNITGVDILREARDVYASTGAACHKGGEPSSILINSGVPKNLASKTLRLSVGRETTEQDVEKAVLFLKNAIEKLSEELQVEN